MKPEWKNAPPWAKWLAKNKSGGWWWYENKPVDIYTAWYEETGKQCLCCMDFVDLNNWRRTLEERPNEF